MKFFDETRGHMAFKDGDTFYADVITSGTFDKRSDIIVGKNIGDTQVVASIHGEEIDADLRWWVHALRVCDTGAEKYIITRSNPWRLAFERTET